MMTIVLSDLSFSYEDFPILETEHLSLQQGTFVGIIGPNGGGKTTFLKLLMGFLTPDHGSISIFGKRPQDARIHIGYVPQYHKSDREFPITVFELVALGALNAANQNRDKVHDLLKMLGLSEHSKKAFGALSGGLAQRALFARALLSDPPILLLDEPTANLDPASTDLILETLAALKRKKTILIATHDWKTIAERADLVLCMQRQISLHEPQEICRHVSLGLYHPPKAKESHVSASIL
jgi:zinc transport system ATP-binding protein